MRALMALAPVVLVAAAMAVELPQRCLWVEDGKVQSQGEMAVCAELASAGEVGMLTALRGGLLAWTTEVRDDAGNLVQFSLNLADLTKGTNRQLLKGLDPFGEGTDWQLQRVQLTESGKALLLRVRLGGTGGFVTVYKMLLVPPAIMHPVDEDTAVWSDEAADGSVRVRPTWALTGDWETAATPDQEARYGTLVVAGKTTPQGRTLWDVLHHAEIPAWAEAEIGGAALAPDARRIAYSNPRGLWLTDVRGQEPTLLFEASEGEGFGEPVWHPDGSGVFVTRYLHLGDGTRRAALWFVRASLPGEREVVREKGRSLVVPR